MADFAVAETRYATSSSFRARFPMLVSVVGPDHALHLLAGKGGLSRIGRHRTKPLAGRLQARRTLGYYPARWPTWRRFDPSSSPSAIETT
jgi:hypothetical protein